MKKVCLFNFPPMENFHGYRIESFDPLSYFPKGSRWPLTDLILWGLNGWDQRRALTAGAAGVDRLYRERNPHYMRMVDDFVDRFRDFDLIVMSTYNFIHPEILVRELKKPVKVLGFIDDPLSTYLRGIPYLWAFDGAFFISPSYIDNLLFDKAMERWGGKPATWWPLVPFPYQRPKHADEAFFSDRDVDVVYVGNPSASKVERLIRLKRHFGHRLRVHGRWPFNGYLGFVRGLFGKPVYPHRVRSLTVEQRTQLYWRTKIGFNMHVSDHPYETGNMRMYEIPAHGMMMVCDKAGADGHARIFTPGAEAVYYDNLDHAIELIEYYLTHDEERIRIARAGFDRYWRDYEWEANLLGFLNWAVRLSRRPCKDDGEQDKR
ncbi:MAG: glycosyltransferase family protein [Pseudomonadota bacterium]